MKLLKSAIKANINLRKLAKSTNYYHQSHTIVAF
jgi:hypothetical protein